MLKLKELSKAKIKLWQKARLKNGEKKYKDSHLKRNNDVDMMEEILDLANIADKKIDRLKEHGLFESEKQRKIHNLFRKKVEAKVNNLINLLQEWSEHTPDECLTDEEGGNRVWVGDYIEQDQSDS